MEFNGKNRAYSEICMIVLTDIYAKNSNPKAIDFARHIASITLAKADDWNNLQPSEQESKIKSEVDYIYSGVTKGLSWLFNNGKIGRKGKAYIPINDANIYQAENYLYNNLKPTQKHIKKISEHTYVLPIDKDSISASSNLTFHHEYRGNFQLLEEDFLKVM